MRMTIKLLTSAHRISLYSIVRPFGSGSIKLRSYKNHESINSRSYHQHNPKLQHFHQPSTSTSTSTSTTAVETLNKIVISSTGIQSDRTSSHPSTDSIINSRRDVREEGEGEGEGEGKNLNHFGTILQSIDPFKLLSAELKRLRLNVVKLIETKDQINLNRVSSYYLSSSANGKMLRPLIVLLISAATTTSTTPLTTTHPQPSSRQIDEPYSPLEILNDFSIPIEPSSSSTSSAILPSQIRLAEITEMIHVASLLHDDVIDLADQRRGQRSSPAEFGNKLSILAGDFLLSRSSVLLSRIGNHQVTELIATAISNLVQGELIQFDQAIVNDRQSERQTQTTNDFDAENRGTGSAVEEDRLSGLKPLEFESLMEDYLRKTYLKTASLMAKTARSTVILSHDPIIHQPLIESVYQFAKNLGLAFQIVDDILDYTGSVEVMGKPSNGSDLKLGLITAPTLYAWLEHPELGELIRRRFKNQGDVELVQSIVISSGAIPSSYRLAQGFIDRAKLELIKSVKPSEFRSGLENLCDMVINRQK